VGVGHISFYMGSIFILPFYDPWSLGFYVLFYTVYAVIFHPAFLFSGCLFSLVSLVTGCLWDRQGMNGSIN